MSNTRKQILIYGATGSQGAPVAYRLLREGFSVRAIVRDEKKAHELRKAGAEIVVGDLNDSKSLKVANRGIDSVYLILPLLFDSSLPQYGKNAIDAAKEAGVEHFVFNTSVVGINADVGVKALDMKREVETYLKESGLAYAIIRPTIYMDNLAAPWSAPLIVDRSIVVYPIAPDFKMSWICLEDVAKFSVEVLKRPDLTSAIFDIGGGDALTGSKIAALLTSKLGREVTFVPSPLEQFEQQMNAGMGAPVGTEIASLYRWLMEQPESPVVVNSHATFEAMSVQPTSMEEWIDRQDWKALGETEPQSAPL